MYLNANKLTAPEMSDEVFLLTGTRNCFFHHFFIGVLPTKTWYLQLLCRGEMIKLNKNSFIAT